MGEITSALEVSSFYADKTYLGNVNWPQTPMWMVSFHDGSELLTNLLTASRLGRYNLETLSSKEHN